MVRTISPIKIRIIGKKKSQVANDAKYYFAVKDTEEHVKNTVNVLTTVLLPIINIR